jgi:hypothetical protein
MANTITAMTTVIRIKHRQETVVNGAPKVSYADADPSLDCCCWKNSGRGKVAERDGVLTYVDAVDVVMWFRPDISIKDHIVLEDTGQEYEIISPPENVDMRYQYLAFKVQRVGGA